MSVPVRLPAPRLAPARRPSWLAGRLGPMVATFAPTTRTDPMRLWWAGLVVGAVLGWRLLGLVGAVVVAAGAVLLPLVGPGLVAAREQAMDNAQLAERAATVARALRAGHPMIDAIDSAAGDGLPTARRWRTMVDQVRLGRSLDESLDEAAAAAADDERIVLTGLRVGLSEGGKVAAAAAVMAGRLRHERELVARRRVLTTQARTSAWVLAALPIVFGLAMVAMRGPDAWLRPMGLAAVVSGLGLELVGVLWMRAMVRRIR